MPKIFPTESLVSWPSTEGTIGVVGVAPWATIDFLQALYYQVNAEKDWDYPRVITDINTKIPSRGRFFELSERDPSPFIKSSIAELAEMGATVVVVPCNTAHILYSSWQDGATVAVPSIIDAAVAEITTCQISKVAVLASSAIAEYQIYSLPIKAAGFEYLILSTQQQSIVTDVIAQIKINGRPNATSSKKIGLLLEELSKQGVDGLILGCTELKCFELLCKDIFRGVVPINRVLFSYCMVRNG